MAIVGFGLIVVLVVLNFSSNSNQAAVPPSSIYEPIYAQDVFGVVVDEKMTIVGIDPGSAAEKAGIKIGDTLKSLDDVSPSSARDAKGMLIEKVDKAVITSVKNKTALVKPTIKLVVEREGKEVSLAVTPSPQRASKGPPPTAVPQYHTYF